MGRVAFFFIKRFLKCDGFYTPSHLRWEGIYMLSHFRCDGVNTPSSLRCDGVIFSSWHIKSVALEIYRRIVKEMVD